MDELAVGFSLGLLRLPLVVVVIAIALQALIVSQLGLWLGRKLNAQVPSIAERLAGAVLIGIGTLLLMQSF